MRWRASTASISTAVLVAIERRKDCLICHDTAATAGVPGMLVRSLGQQHVDHRLPIEERWGGWYVTGQHGTIRHKGNIETGRVFLPTPPTDGLNWPSLDGKFDATGCPTETPIHGTAGCRSPIARRLSRS